MIRVHMDKDDADFSAELIGEIVKMYIREKTPFGQMKEKAENIRRCQRIAGLLYAAEEVEE